VKPYYAVVTRVTLEQATNEAGIRFSRAVFTKVADLDRDTAKVIKDMADKLRPLTLQVGFEPGEVGGESDDPGVISINA